MVFQSACFPPWKSHFINDLIKMWKAWLSALFIGGWEARTEEDQGPDREGRVGAQPSRDPHGAHPGANTPMGGVQLEKVAP